VLVLVWRPGVATPLQMGTAFSRIGVITPDADSLVRRVSAAGFVHFVR
jgi:hypothetical protein